MEIVTRSERLSSVGFLTCSADLGDVEAVTRSERLSSVGCLTCSADLVVLEVVGVGLVVREFAVVGLVVVVVVVVPDCARALKTFWVKKSPSDAVVGMGLDVLLEPRGLTS